MTTPFDLMGIFAAIDFEKRNCYKEEDKQMIFAKAQKLHNGVRGTNSRVIDTLKTDLLELLLVSVEACPEDTNFMYRVAVIFKHSGKYTEAEDFIRTVIFKHTGKYTEAEELIRRALALQEDAKGPGSAEVFMCCHTLALILEEKGDYTNAEKTCNREHEQVAAACNSLGGLLLLKHDDAFRSHGHICCY